MADFFAISPLGFESDLEAEIQTQASLLKIKSIKTTEIKGGVEFVTDIFSASILNYHLKLATRILYRYCQFESYYFNQLENQLEKIKWNDVYPGKAKILVKIQSKKSKLGQEKKIFAVFEKVLKSFDLYFKPSEAPEDAFILYVDFYQDLCKISIDLTGEALYKRTLNKLVGEAPIRETIAHWGLQKILNEVTPWAKPFVFVDPFCGSGTLLAETLNYFYPVNRIMSCEKLLLVGNKVTQYKNFDLPKYSELLNPLPFVKYYGFEKDLKTFQKLSENAKSIVISRMELKNKDSLISSDIVEKNIWIYTNPPYGKRIDAQETNELVNRIEELYQPSVFAFYYPQKLKSTRAQKVIHHSLENGGMKIFLNIFIYKS